MTAPTDAAFTFNVVVTGDVFWHLRYFVASLVAQSAARFRLVANACTPGCLQLMEAFAAAHPDRVVEILDVSSDRMIAHGVALDAVRRVRDDGHHFCFADADIKARRPFLGDFAVRLADHVAVTSGQEVWTDDNVVPDGHPGLGGRHFFRSDGFVYGSPHFAMYHRAPLDETSARWGVGFGSAGPDVSLEGQARLAAGGHNYRMYDTGKLVNIFLQEDGHQVCHFDHPDLVHIGGLAHFLSPPDPGARGGEEEPPRWTRNRGMEARHAVARFTAQCLRAEIEGRPRPPIPGDADAALAARLRLVRDEVRGLTDGVVS